VVLQPFGPESYPYWGWTECRAGWRY